MGRRISWLLDKPGWDISWPNMNSLSNAIEGEGRSLKRRTYFPMLLMPALGCPTTLIWSFGLVMAVKGWSARGCYQHIRDKHAGGTDYGEVPESLQSHCFISEQNWTEAAGGSWGPFMKGPCIPWRRKSDVGGHHPVRLVFVVSVGRRSSGTIPANQRALRRAPHVFASLNPDREVTCED